MDNTATLFDASRAEPIRDPIWKHILFPSEFLPILATPAFSKLARIRQLGPAWLAYPGATHTRYAHSLGVFEMAKRTLASLARSGLPTFVTREGERSFLAAALVHDVGHFPYAHSLKELPLEDHEALTARNILESGFARRLDEAGADPETVASIVDKARPVGGDREIDFFRRCLSGVLDPDKLDYLTRDAWFCGVPYGIQDVDFVFQHLAVTPDGRPGIDERGIMSVEGILFSKYLMYKSVYWQRTVRAATAMIKKAVFSLLAKGSLDPESLYGRDDSDFRTLIEASGEPEASIVGRVFTGNLYATVLEVPFDGNKPGHRAVLDLESRAAAERECARALSLGESRLDPLDVIIDLPESIGFETDLPVVDLGIEFRASPTVFTEDVVRAFASSLRTLRLLLPASAGMSVREIRERTGL
ncbi:MAG: HD domain-containing protein [Spirochaetes bacterium]|nr:HD domain-containing protein [Spirochaetota bacterium]